jgi:hypothetical protein
MALIYALVARGNTILAEYTDSSGACAPSTAALAPACWAHTPIARGVWVEGMQATSPP